MGTEKTRTEPVQFAETEMSLTPGSTHVTEIVTQLWTGGAVEPPPIQRRFERGAAAPFVTGAAALIRINE